MGKTIIFSILIILFLIIQVTPSLYAESCIESLNIEFSVYELNEKKDKLSYKYEKSPYQPEGEDGFVREGDVLLIERVVAKINPLCNKELEDFLIEFKRPSKEVWGEQLQVVFRLGRNNVSEYILELEEGLTTFKDSLNNTKMGGTTGKSLNEEGVWGLRILYPEKNVYENYSLTNKGFLIVGNEVVVLDRLSVTELETLRQIQDQGNLSFWRNLIVSIITILIILGIGYATIRVMREHHKEQTDKMDEHYDKQTKKEDKREEEKQINLLESLYSELDAISSKKKKIELLNIKISTEGNLQWIKKLLKENRSPGHGIWNLNTQVYVTGLDAIIKRKKTKKLKDTLIHITQKIELIGNYLSTHRQTKERELEKHAQIIGEAIIKTVNEMLTLVEATKKFLESEFGINKK